MDNSEAIKRFEQFKQLTQSTGWPEFLNLLNGIWEDAFKTFMDANMKEGGYETVIESRAKMKVITEVLDQMDGKIKLGEKMKDKLKSKQLQRRQDVT